MGDNGAFAETLANEIAEVGGFIVESAGRVGFVKLDDAAADGVDSGAFRIPPIGMKENVAARAAEQRISAAAEVDAGVELRHAALVFRLEDGEVVDAGGSEAAHGLNALERAEPVESEEGFVGSDAHDAAPTEFREVERVIRTDRGVAVAGAHKADGADGIRYERFAKALVEGKEWRLHGFHEEAVVLTGGGEHVLNLADVEASRLLTEDVFAGGEGTKAKVGVGVRVGGDVDGVDVGSEQGIEGGSDGGDGEFLREDGGLFRIAAPHRGEAGLADGGKAVGEASGCAAGADDGKADLLLSLRHGNRVARWGCSLASQRCFAPLRVTLIFAVRGMFSGEGLRGWC